MRPTRVAANEDERTFLCGDNIEHRTSDNRINNTASLACVWLRSSIFGVWCSMFLSCAGKSTVPIFPHRFEAALTKNCGYFGRRALIADLELPCRKLVFSVLKFGGDDSAPNGAMQMFAALSSVSTRLGMAAGAHHRYA